MKFRGHARVYQFTVTVVPSGHNISRYKIITMESRFSALHWFFVALECWLTLSGFS
jgi:hypothetical protein